ncbi:MAG: transposase [Bacteroidales bacterium]|nr:transposase [Bacteroidales bacterium]
MNRKVADGEVHHIYQKTKGGVLLFYSLRDYLVFFTIYCIFAEKLDVTVLALCPMPDHLHSACRFMNAEQMVKFVQMYTHCFSREWNKSRRRRNSLFQKRFGSAVKLGNKAVRTTINYNYNNPVERKIVSRAEDYRWNFLKYFRNRNPYSKPLDESASSCKLRRALQDVRAVYKRGEWVRYAQLDLWMKDLSADEVQQLADYIISTWNVIDYVGAISYYGDFDAMIRSFHDNTGSEYEIREDKDNYSDAVYSDCTRILMKEGLISSVREVPGLPIFKKLELYKLLSSRTAAKPVQVRKYLHLVDGGG